VILLRSSIHEIFATYADEYIAAYRPPYAHIKAINHIRTCRTPALGAAAYDCGCGETTYVYHSCRDRHCPVCQGSNNQRWAAKQLASSLPVKYFHVVFTLPDILNGFVMANPKESYSALFEAASKALLILCADKKHGGFTPGFTSVLHTWGQTMQFHPHLHLIVTAGGLAEGGLRFFDVSERGFLVPVKALSKLFRGIFIDALSRMAPLPDGLKYELYAKDFSCHLEKPMERMDNAVLYMARYANRVCISDSRVICVDKASRTVTFSYKDNKTGGDDKQMTIDVFEFMRRFLLHVLPKRFMKIRHFGILQNKNKAVRVARCLRLLGAKGIRLRKMPRGSPSNLRRFLCPICGKPLPPPRHIGAASLLANIRLIC